MTIDTTGMNETELLIHQTVEAMIADGSKISPHSVAKRMGRNHAIIYKYPRQKERIADLKRKQKAARESADLQRVNEKQKQQIEKLQSKVTEGSTTTSDFKAKETALMAKLIETYRLYDDMRAERDDMVNRAAHGVDAVNRETGEIMAGKFR